MNKAELIGKVAELADCIKIAASKAPKFSAGKGLKDAVNG